MHNNVYMPRCKAYFFLRVVVGTCFGGPPLHLPAPQAFSPCGLWYFLSSLNSRCSPGSGRARCLEAEPRPSSSSSLERAGRGPPLQGGTQGSLCVHTRGSWGAHAVPTLSFFPGLKQQPGQGFSPPKDPYWSPVCLLSALGLSPNPRVAMRSSSSSKNNSSFFRTGVSPGVRGMEGPKIQNTGHSAQLSCPPL